MSIRLVIESSAQVYSFPLISWKHDQEAVFEQTDKMTKITYRSNSKDTLQSTVEHMGHKTEVYEVVHTPE